MMPRNDSDFPEAGDQPSYRTDSTPVAGRIDPMPVQPRQEGSLPPGLNAGPDAMSLLRGLGRRWLMAVTLGGLLALTGAAGVYYLLNPKHTASSQIRVLYTEPLIGRREQSGAGGFATFLKSQALLLTSRPIISKALLYDEVKRLDLASKYPDVVSHLSEELKVETTETSEFLTLTYSCNDANQAKVIIKAITDAYMDYQQFLDQDGKKLRLREVETAWNEGRAALTEKIKLHENKISESGNDGDALLRQAERYRMDMQEVTAQRHGWAVELAKLEGEKQVLEGRLKAAKDVVIPDADVQRNLEADLQARPMIFDLARASVVVRDYEHTGMTADNPLAPPTYLRSKDLVDRLKPQLEKRRVALRDEMQQRLVQAAEQERQYSLAVMEGRGKSLTKALAETNKEFERLSKLVIAFNRIPGDIKNAEHDIEQKRVQLDNLASQMAELQLVLRSQPRITVYQESDLLKRDTKKQMLGTIAAPTGILGMVCMILAYGDYRQRRVRSARDMANGLGITVFGTVPEVKNPERHLIGPVTEPEIDAQPVLESIDHLRTQLLHSSSQESCRVVLVTSAVSGEGKTTVASHLATSLARAGRKTLLVDGDLRRPALHQLFELPQQPGLSEVLLGEVESADAVQATTLEGLSVITAGQWDREVMQALARGSLAGVFEKLRQEFDFVIVDSHPVLAATDSLVIAQQVEGVILAVRRDLSQSPRVYAAQQKLASLNVRLLGAVLSGGDPMEVYGKPVAQTTAAA